MRNTINVKEEFIPDWYRKPILVLGCGNVLFGDDGFGPAVIEYLKKNYKVRNDVSLIDAGTGVREILFDIILSEKKPKKIIIVDAINTGSQEPGEIFQLSIDNLPENKIDDFSLHQLPTSNMLKELKEICEVKIVVAEVRNLPQEVKIGLSENLCQAIPEACERILKLCTNGD